MDVPQTLGKYDIRGTLGQGAMGIVYDGWDPLIARRVAIKSVPLPANPDPETAEEIARFRREAQAAGRLSHPNIVGVYDYGETSDLAYIVMEFVDGPTLKSVMDKKERFPLENIRKIMDDVLSGLQFSHERGVVHRDIKPGNIMLTSDGRAKIADFGIARIEMSSMTQAGTMLGTPAYMSPEQFRGEAADARTDVYSAGVLLYQLLTGERPFEGGLTAIMHKVLNTEPPAPSALAGTVPAAVDAVVLQAIAKRPQDRFASASAFAEALRAAIAGTAAPATAGGDDEATMVRPRTAAAATGTARPAPAPHPAPAPVAPAAGGSKLPLLAGVGVVALLAVGGGAWFLTRPAPPPPVQSQPAQSQPAQTAEATPAPAAPPAAETPAPAPAPTPAPAPVVTAPPPATAEAQAAPTPAQAAPAEPTPAPAPIQSTPAQPAQVQPAPVQVAVAPATTPAPPAPQAQTTPAEPPAPPPVVAQTPAPVVAPAPVVTPAPAPQPVAPPQVAPPPPTQTASIVPAAMLQQISQALHAARCAVADAAARDGGGVTVGGFADAATAAALQRQIGGIAGAQPMAWHVHTVDPVFCPALALLRPVSALAGAPGQGVGLTLAGNRTVLKDGEPILPRLTMPDFGGEVRVDYFAHDGTLAHLFPTLAEPANKLAAQPAKKLAAGEHLALGDPGPGKPQWQSGEPYGTDMILAVASSVPLKLAPARNAEEKADGYLADLNRAIEQARAAGARVSGTLLLVDAVPKPK